MCDELGDEEYMQNYVESVAKTSLCDTSDPVMCTEKEVTFIEKWKESPKEKSVTELKRLQGMLGSKLTATQKKWLSQRVKILAQFAGSDEL